MLVWVLALVSVLLPSDVVAELVVVVEELFSVSSGFLSVFEPRRLGTTIGWA